MFLFLPPEASFIVAQAQLRGLPGSQPPPAYLAPDLCTVLSLLLAVPSLGYSLLLFPVVWVAQHERTNRRIERLRNQLQQAEEPWPAAQGRAVEHSWRQQAGRVPILPL